MEEEEWYGIVEFNVPLEEEEEFIFRTKTKHKDE